MFLSSFFKSFTRSILLLLQTLKSVQEMSLPPFHAVVCAVVKLSFSLLFLLNHHGCLFPGWTTLHPVQISSLMTKKTLTKRSKVKSQSAYLWKKLNGKPDESSFPMDRYYLERVFMFYIRAHSFVCDS